MAKKLGEKIAGKRRNVYICTHEHYVRENLLESEPEALVNTVIIVGVIGKG